ncbi:MAG: type II toxin-antitoxin system RelE/ParE family toxin [Desulfobulbus sp.]|nr:type II toxin-antitoxin system RelE/ParE family toxin [Desulfobulbus sp.]
MTITGAGGVTVFSWRRSKTFHREYSKLPYDLCVQVDQKLQDLLRSPFPPGLRFEKLKGYSDPDIYTIHVTGNYKISFEIRDGNNAWLRRVANHDDIDRSP